MPALTVITLILLSIAVAVGLVVADRAGKRRAAREEADELEAARLRLVEAGEDPDAPEIFAGTGGGNRPGGKVYASRHAADTAPPAEPLDKRTAVLVVDPTLTATEVATIVEHVEPGAGSLASLAATVCDTREMRTGAEERHLAEVYEAAHDENTVRDLDAATGDLWSAHEDVWAAIDAWVERYHGKTHYASCVHCAETLHEHSDEFAQLVSRVESEHTGEISRAALFAGV